ncbi:hypothetical protein J6590_014333 [Homalodisca vitripennis]|nr:hypothetical protein J6590_014333 [Homalodisca vitripennis]
MKLISLEDARVSAGRTARDCLHSARDRATRPTVERRPESPAGACVAAAVVKAICRSRSISWRKEVQLPLG